MSQAVIFFSFCLLSAKTFRWEEKKTVFMQTHGCFHFYTKHHLT